MIYLSAISASNEYWTSFRAPVWPLGVGLNRIISWGGFLKGMDRDYDLMAELTLATTSGNAVNVQVAGGRRMVHCASSSVYIRAADPLQRGPATLRFDIEGCGYRQTGLEGGIWLQ